jgi:probable HAF family extracellular repeat protein
MAALHPRAAAGIFLVAVGGACSVGAGQPRITNLGTLGGGSSYANAISADGRVVVGSSSLGGDQFVHAFRWSAGTGMQDVGCFMAQSNSYGTAVSADGKTVGGFSPASASAIHAFRWQLGEMDDLGTLGGADSIAMALSADGSVAVGAAALPGAGGDRACRWSRVDGLQPLVGPDGTDSKAYGISHNGSAVVGIADAPDGASVRAMLWESGAANDLGTLGGASSRAFAISGDGSTVVGIADTPDGRQAFRWTLEDGMQGLGTLHRSASAAYASSFDGRVIAGYDSVPTIGSSHAFLWSPSLGMVDLNVYLPTFGCDLTGWTLIGVNGISSDGGSVVGNGLFNGQHRGFLISGIPTSVCAADFNHSGSLSTLDIYAFLNAWFGGLARADFNQLDGITVQDVFDFLNAWLAGC